MNVLVVESPAKAKTINKYLGDNYKVLASFGHIRDLPSKDGSVKPDQDFAMLWDVDARAQSKITDIAKAVKGADKLILATDPDREGEAISWHILEVLRNKNVLGKMPVERVAFNAITKTAVTEAIQHPREINKELVDACTARMVNRPASLDTLVATNLHADILSDLAAALAGSLGIAPTGNIDPQRRYPSKFEPIHGSAFDIMGQGLANLVGTFWSCVMLLEHLGEKESAARLMKVIESITADPKLHTGDLGGKARTKDVTAAVCRRLLEH